METTVPEGTGNQLNGIVPKGTVPFFFTYVKTLPVVTFESTIT